MRWGRPRKLGIAERHGWTRFVSMQNHYNLAYREEEREMLPLLRDQGVACIPWSPLARGFLTEGPVAAATPAAPDRRRSADPLRIQYYAGEADAAVARVVGEVARERNWSRARVACAWLLSSTSASGGVTAPIVGPSSVEQLEDLASAPDMELTREEARRLETPYLPKRVLGHF